MEKFCLKWNDFQANVSKSFSALRKEEDFYDVTLVTDDEQHIALVLQKHSQEDSTLQSPDLFEWIQLHIFAVNDGLHL